jgi:inosine-uridine nucleoside N-ribohydrolase
MKFIIDTDMGIDDAMALLMVLAQPQAELLAITSVVGNISLAQATHNVGVMLNVAAARPSPFTGAAPNPCCNINRNMPRVFTAPTAWAGPAAPPPAPLKPNTPP